MYYIKNVNNLLTRRAAYEFFIRRVAAVYVLVARQAMYVFAALQLRVFTHRADIIFFKAQPPL